MSIATPTPLAFPVMRAFWRRSVRRCWQAWWYAAIGIFGRSGLEVGGPSGLFKSSGLLPVYGLPRRLDNLTFSSRTIWQRPTEAATVEGAPYRTGSGGGGGLQLIGEASDLQGELDNARAFVLASHVIEHVANPLRALREWRRITCVGGRLVLIVPHRDGTFDHHRPVTALGHLQQDERDRVDESDTTHFSEIMRLHDLGRDPGAGARDEFERRTLDNLSNRSIHHHVFDTALALAMVDQAGWLIRAVQLRQPYHIVLVCSKPAAGVVADNRAYLAPDAKWRHRSPFPSDRSV